MKKPAAMTYQEITPDFLRNKLKLKHLEVKKTFNKKFPHAEKFFKERGIDFEKIREHSGKIISAGALTGALLLGSPTNVSLPKPADIVQKVKTIGEKSVAPQASQKELLNEVSQVLPQETRPLTRDEEKKLEQIFTNTTGVKARATLEGEHLNTTYGLIGAEQHLRRYPGDSMYNHPALPVNDEGMAPGLGGWGYFAPSEDKLTPDLVEKEKWYAVVQTLYLPDWQARLKYLVNWYKYRKVLIVNTDNGNAVVADIADAGPAAWTGKSFGGSPEVMNYLGGPNYKKGPVVIFFVDDPNNQVPLGPVDYNKQELPLGVRIVEANI
jgi:hypothetical protein